MNEDINFLPAGGKLPNDTTALVLAIAGAVLLLTGCCCGLFTTIPALICAIMGFVLSGKAIKIYELNPTNYQLQSYNNVKMAKIISIIALILSAIWVVANILFLVGAIASPEFMNEYQNKIRSMQ
ncbi:hypothetical protein BAX97_06290 [Elizabethkingia meningoseptica]|uniref:CCC motif membrane protein n=1 Tax=Elizabethkingia meningoseptica TaxID=238 RepID=UPI000936D259|nr:CCC motif membrane protein [Elizabethkingia meningoseptica]MDE5490528.1 hypothetical protein [Elizabethkingia meningoseptica]MVW93163.1 hypothetical protein [Elizabethkingia meningoseptica]OPC28666.1 hypothetical protein BAX97_06290 [Elizabethkingia meningoseptica]